MNAIDVLFGAALVAIGVLAAAVGDRIRGLRISRSATTRRETEVPAAKIEVVDAVLVEEIGPREADVIEVLIAAGYKKTAAAAAVRGCPIAERSTIERWTAAALRRAGRNAS